MEFYLPKGFQCIQIIQPCNLAYTDIHLYPPTVSKFLYVLISHSEANSVPFKGNGLHCSDVESSGLGVIFNPSTFVRLYNNNNMVMAGALFI